MPPALPPPSPPDATYDFKYGIRAVAGGGRSSARETIGRVAAGAVAKKLLRQVRAQRRGSTCGWPGMLAGVPAAGCMHAWVGCRMGPRASAEGILRHHSRMGAPHLRDTCVTGGGH